MHWRCVALLAAVVCAGCQTSPNRTTADPFLRAATVPAPPTGAAVPAGTADPYYGTSALTSPSSLTIPQSTAPGSAQAPPPASFYRQSAFPNSPNATGATPMSATAPGNMYPGNASPIAPTSAPARPTWTAANNPAANAYPGNGYAGAPSYGSDAAGNVASSGVVPASYNAPVNATNPGSLPYSTPSNASLPVGRSVTLEPRVQPPSTMPTPPSYSNSSIDITDLPPARSSAMNASGMSAAAPTTTTVRRPILDASARETTTWTR